MRSEKMMSYFAKAALYQHIGFAAGAGEGNVQLAVGRTRRGRMFNNDDGQEFCPVPCGWSAHSRAGAGTG